MVRKQRRNLGAETRNLQNISLHGFTPVMSKRVNHQFNVEKIPYRSSKASQDQRYMLTTNSETNNLHLNLTEPLKLPQRFIIPAINSHPFQENMHRCEKFLDLTASCPERLPLRPALTKTSLYTPATLPRFRKPTSNRFQNSFSINPRSKEKKSVTILPNIKVNNGKSLPTTKLQTLPPRIPPLKVKGNSGKEADTSPTDPVEGAGGFISDSSAEDLADFVFCNTPCKESVLLGFDTSKVEEQVENTSETPSETSLHQLPEFNERSILNKKSVLPSISFLSDLVSNHRLAACQAAGDPFASYYKYHGVNKLVIDERVYDSYSRTCKMPTTQPNR